MSERNEHNEPWEVTGNEVWATKTFNNIPRRTHLVAEFGTTSSRDRAVLCVNACVSMSDEEVEIIQPELAILKNNLQAEEHIGEELRAFCLKLDEERASLHIKLDEAVVLLEGRCWDCTMGHDGCGKCKVKTFFVKHREAKGG